MYDMQIYFMFIGLADFYPVFLYNFDVLNPGNA